MLHRPVSFAFADAPPPRLDKALARDVPAAANLSRTRLARLISDGAVRIDGLVIKDSRAKVTAGQLVEIAVASAEESHLTAEKLPLDVVFEDDDVIVVNKAPGMVVHPAPGSPSGTLVNALMAHCGAALSGVGGVKRPGIVHRIDKDTSGLLVVAKTDAAHHGLAGQFEKHTVERMYHALVYGVPDANDPRLHGVKGVSFEPGNILKLTTQLARHKTDRQRQAVLFQGGRHAVTRARCVARFGNPAALALLTCWLETGRTHQIRVHLAHAGHGLIGDPVYGRARKLAKDAFPSDAVTAVRQFPRQALHAAVLGFSHPISGAMMRFEAPRPADFETLLAQLGMLAQARAS
ncbi:MAG: RluA family pseudouridine synthase [Pseudomonadota bacterium]